MKREIGKGNEALLLNAVIQFIKFSLVGAINTLLSLAIYYLMIILKIDYMIATVTGYVGSSLVGYLLNRMWVFNAQNTKISKTITKYYLIYGTSLLINMGCMYFWIDIQHISQMVAPILTLCITIPYNYLLSKFWAFKTEM